MMILPLLFKENNTINNHFINMYLLIYLTVKRYIPDIIFTILGNNELHWQS